MRAGQLSLRKNVIANYLGQGWRALMGFAFVPLYIRYLGMEAYGLIGVFALLQAWLMLLDGGLKPALGREMAKFTAGSSDARSIGNLLRSVEMVAFAVAGLIVVALWFGSQWLAVNWVKTDRLPENVVSEAFCAMGFIAALRVIENVYVGCVVGLQRQVLENIVTSSMASVRGFGAVAVLIWISPTLSAYFIWQSVVSIITVVVFMLAVYSQLPREARTGRFSVDSLKAVWAFARGMLAIALLVLLLTQVDKLLLSRLLSLESFAYYALAGLVANSLLLLSGPITTAFYPRFIEYVMRENQPALISAYHEASQLITVSVGAAAVILIVFSKQVLLLWTADSVLATRTAPLLSLLATGSLFNALMWIPYHMQLAHAWTSLTIKVNTVAVLILVPAIVLVVPAYGGMGAACIWVLLNAGYLVFDIYAMHRRLLPDQKKVWYVNDVALPLSAAVLVGLTLRWILPTDLTKIEGVAALALCSSLVVVAAFLSASSLRARCFSMLSSAI